MLRATTIGLVSAVALGFSLAAPVYAMHGGGGSGGHNGGGFSGGSGMRGGPSGGISTLSIKSGSGPSNFSQNMSPMHMYHDHDHDGDRDHDHDRRHFRFFPTFAYGIDTYADNYDPACWEVVRVKTHLGWHYRRIWVCDQTIY